MTQRIEIDFEPAEGQVVRLIGLVERRGYELLGVSFQPAAMGGKGRLDMSVRPRPGPRRMETLKAQIRRVYGVLSVRELSSEPLRESA
ncbi:MAG: ACT domain-containing protein [Glycocaulis sp.]